MESRDGVLFGWMIGLTLFKVGEGVLLNYRRQTLSAWIPKPCLDRASGAISEDAGYESERWSNIQGWICLEELSV